MYPNGPGLGCQDGLPRCVRGIMAAMGAAVANTNTSIQILTDTMQQGRDQASVGGFRTLKPKKDITNITAEDAPTLMVQLDQFEIDLGEIGLMPQTEAGYRQLRAVCTGRAREIVDLCTAHGKGLMLVQYLKQLVFCATTSCKCTTIT